MTSTRDAANATKPGTPTLSIIPVSGRLVLAGVVVRSCSACSVNKAATVAVLGSTVASAPAPISGVSVGAKTGVGLGVAVFGALVGVILGVEVHDLASAVISLIMATSVFWALISAISVL